jgi:hypothetical protein
MNDMSQAPAQFHFDREDEVLETRYMGTLSLHDIGFERVEAILFEEGQRAKAVDESADEDAKKTMMDRSIRRLIVESVTGEHGERFTGDEQLPGRLMMDMMKLRKAIVRMYGLDQEEVKNE